MTIRFLPIVIFFFFTLVISGCNLNTSCLNIKILDACISCKVGNYGKEKQYDFSKASVQFENFLITENLLKDKSKEGYIQLFQNTKSLKKDVIMKKLISEFDDTFYGSSVVYGYFVECAKKNEDNSLATLSKMVSNKSEKFYSTLAYKIQVLNTINEEIFEKTEVKMLFLILIYNEISSYN